MAPKLPPASRTRRIGTAPKAKEARSPVPRLISLLFNRSPKEASPASIHDASKGLDGIAAELDAGLSDKVY